MYLSPTYAEKHVVNSMPNIGLNLLGLNSRKRQECGFGQVLPGFSRVSTRSGCGQVRPTVGVNGTRRYLYLDHDEERGCAGGGLVVFLPVRAGQYSSRRRQQ